MSQSLTYPSNKLLSLTNVTPWNIYLLELLFAFPDMGVAIRSGVPFVLNEPTMDDRFKNSNTRKYTFRQDGVTLDGESRKDFLSAITTYEKLEARRKDEEARACALITSSFSEEAKMQLRTNADLLGTLKTDPSSLPLAMLPLLSIPIPAAVSFLSPSASVEIAHPSMSSLRFRLQRSQSTQLTRSTTRSPKPLSVSSTIATILLGSDIHSKIPHLWRMIVLQPSASYWPRSSPRIRKISSFKIAMSVLPIKKRSSLLFMSYPRDSLLISMLSHVDQLTSKLNALSS